MNGVNTVVKKFSFSMGLLVVAILLLTVGCCTYNDAVTEIKIISQDKTLLCEEISLSASVYDNTFKCRSTNGTVHYFDKTQVEACLSDSNFCMRYFE